MSETLVNPLAELTVCVALFNCGSCANPKGITFVTYNNGSATTYALVTDQFQKTVTQINASGVNTGQVVNDIAVGDGPFGLSVLNNNTANPTVGLDCA